MFIKVHNLAPKSEHAERMRNYKDPSKAATGSKWGRKKTGSAPTVGDFAGVVYEVAYDRMTEGQYKVVDGRKVEIASDWDLARVNSWLDAVATATDGPERQALFTTLVRELPPTEQKWIIRVIMGDMKLGVKQESVLGWYHPDAMEAYHKVQNLKAVCEDRDLMDRSRRSRRSLAAGTPFSPMTAGKFVMDDSKPDFLSGWNDFFIEQKLDGERMVVHKVPSGRSGSGSGSGGGGDEIKIFSRQSIDNSLYASVMRGHFNKAVSAWFVGALRPSLRHCGFGCCGLRLRTSQSGSRVILGVSACIMLCSSGKVSCALFVQRRARSQGRSSPSSLRFFDHIVIT